MPIALQGLVWAYKVATMTMHEFFTVDGVSFPYPVNGLEYIYTDAVNNGRNCDAEMIGEHVGRTQSKLNNLEWKMLDAYTVHRMIRAFDKFFVIVHYWDLREWGWVDLKMYPGDRTAKPYYRMSGSVPDRIESFKVNIIDCGIL